MPSPSRTPHLSPTTASSPGVARDNWPLPSGPLFTAFPWHASNASFPLSLSRRSLSSSWWSEIYLDTTLTLEERWMITKMMYGAQSDRFDYHMVKALSCLPI